MSFDQITQLAPKLIIPVGLILFGGAGMMGKFGDSQFNKRLGAVGVALGVLILVLLKNAGWFY